MSRANGFARLKITNYVQHHIVVLLPYIINVTKSDSLSHYLVWGSQFITDNVDMHHSALPVQYGYKNLGQHCVLIIFINDYVSILLIRTLIDIFEPLVQRTQFSNILPRTQFSKISIQTPFSDLEPGISFPNFTFRTQFSESMFRTVFRILRSCISFANTNYAI